MAWSLVWWVWGCAGPAPEVPRPDPPSDTGSDTLDPYPELGPGVVPVQVLLDGEPVRTTVYLGGHHEPFLTDAAGQLELQLQRDGREALTATHPDARPAVQQIYPSTASVLLELARFDRSDNEGYTFQDPGSPDDNGDTSKCAHCHTTINEAWHASVHRTSASNPVVHDVYAGTAAALSDAEACAGAGGQWWVGSQPGTGAAGWRCYLGSGTLPDLDPSCGDDQPCDEIASQTGGCADCHAPGIDGALGGRDLLEARELAYTYGVHCDVCHKVESVFVGAPAGVAGWLGILRPTELGGVGGLEHTPLTFGPYGDVPNPRMGDVGRDLFYDAELCGGCHELHQPVWAPSAAIDTGRWPQGVLPIHTTYSEWLSGPLSPQAPCSSCHMPPDPSVGNGADLGNVTSGEGIAAGWLRPPGAVRSHSFVGPRRSEPGLLELAAAIDLSGASQDGAWVVTATVTNAGAGHALPTGEPMRAVLLRVEASCDGVPQAPIGGDVLPAWAGAHDVQDASGDWGRWPGARPGDRIRVVARPGGFRDYDGFGPFGDGTFSPEEKGLPVELWAGESTVVSVAGDVVTLDAPLPQGDRAYRVDALASPVGGEPPAPLAGAPGAAFARVLVDARGQPMVPHHAAVDVASDNRLMPLASATSTHRFAQGCAQPTTHATLLHRALPHALVSERRWDVTDRVIAEVSL